MPLSIGPENAVFVLIAGGKFVAGRVPVDSYDGVTRKKGDGGGPFQDEESEREEKEKRADVWMDGVGQFCRVSVATPPPPIPHRSSWCCVCDHVAGAFESANDGDPTDI